MPYASPMGRQPDDQYSADETEQRVRAALRGAFSKGPTPLKAIPKRNGEFADRL